MQLKPSERVWAPPEMEEIWTVIPQGREAPKTLTEVLELQAAMAERLVEEAGADLGLADDLVQASPQAAALGPGDAEALTWKDKLLPRRLMASPAVDGTWHQKWRETIREAVKTPQPLTRSREVMAVMADLNLAMWVESRF